MTKEIGGLKLLGAVLLVLFCLQFFVYPAEGDAHLNLGVEFSGHVIPYFGLSYRSGVREIGLNLGFGLPHNLYSSTFSDLAYQGTVYYRYDFINTDFYPRIQLKALTAPASADENEFLLMLGGGLQYLYSPGQFRYGGGLGLNLGLPVSALEGFSGPIPYLSLETCYEFD